MPTPNSPEALRLNNPETAPGTEAHTQTDPTELRLGGFAKVVAPSDDHHEQIGKIHAFFDDDDEFDFCMRFSLDTPIR